ncbi:MAG: hypothetical protein GY950_16120, partial [bacterium]|nr:hypothetical protein [bacterium]
MKKYLNPGLIRQISAVIILVQLFWCPAIWGLDPDKSVDLYLVDSCKMPGNISSNLVKAITQTPDGYLWIRTTKGLVRFDGITYLKIPFAGKEEIYPQETVIPDTLYVDREGILWIGTTGVLTSYNYKTGRFKAFTTAHGLTGDCIRFIRDDMRGNLWISFCASYVNRFSNGKFTAFNASHGLGGKKINAIVENQKGNLLFGTSENGVFTYNDGKFFKYPIAGLENLRINTMHEDRKGDLWIGTNNGLFRVNHLTAEPVRKYTAENGLSHNYITYICEDSEHNLWVGTEKGLNRVRKKQNGSVGFESLLKSLTIICLFGDREGNLWIGTDDSGIKRLKDGKFISYAPLEEYREEMIFSLFRDRQGDTWIGTVSGRLFRSRGSNLKESMVPPKLTGTGISAIGEDSEGNPWLGTTGKGVFQNKKGTFVQFTTREGLADNQVTSIYRDSRGGLWFGTFDGVSVIRRPGGVIESLNSRNGLLGKRIHYIYEDKTHNIRIAADKGVTVLKDGKIAKQTIEYYLRGTPVTCIYEDPSPTDSEGRVYWFASNGAGLKRLSLKDGKVTTYTTAHGMTTNFIYRFFEDQQGYFWLMSNSGILRVKKSELNRFARGGAAKINCTSFGTADGMKSPEFNNELSRHSALKTGNGELWFITKKGISIVNPENIRIDKIPPPVLIEAVFFNRKLVPLRYDSTAYTFKGIDRFTAYFTSPTFLSSEKIRFKYRLEGFGKEWVDLPPGSQRVAQYEGLAPGTYTFTVIACNAEGVWNRTGDSIIFILKPYFHQTLLFKIFVL